MGECDKKIDLILDHMARFEQKVEGIAYQNQQLLGQDKLLHIKEAADYLGVSHATTRRRVNSGQYRSVSPARTKMLIKKGDLAKSRSRGIPSALSIL